jgi:hypothetical protein
MQCSSADLASQQQRTMHLQDIWWHLECCELQRHKHKVTAAYLLLLPPLLPLLLELLHHKIKAVKKKPVGIWSSTIDLGAHA